MSCTYIIYHLMSLYKDEINLSNHIDVSMEMFNTSINAVTLVALSEAPFKQLPIQYISNLDCWFSLFEEPSLNSKGVRLKSSNKSLGLEHLDISAKSIRGNVSFLSCSSPDFFEDFSDFLNNPKNEENLTNEANQLFKFISEILSGEFL